MLFNIFTNYAADKFENLAQFRVGISLNYYDNGYGAGPVLEEEYRYTAAVSYYSQCMLNNPNAALINRSKDCLEELGYENYEE